MLADYLPKGNAIMLDNIPRPAIVAVVIVVVILAIVVIVKTTAGGGENAGRPSRADIMKMQQQGGQGAAHQQPKGR